MIATAVKMMTLKKMTAVLLPARGKTKVEKFCILSIFKIL
jgi:hypothetical protein